MEKKSLRNKLKARCNKTCKGIILDKERGIYCKHIERKMPKASRNSIDAFSFGSRIDNMADNKKNISSEDEIEKALIDKGFDNNEIDLFFNKVYGYTRGKKWLNKHNMDAHWSKLVKRIKRLGKGIFYG